MYVYVCTCVLYMYVGVCMYVCTYVWMDGCVYVCISVILYVFI
jgi:hypothetical protein